MYVIYFILSYIIAFFSILQRSPGQFSDSFPLIHYYRIMTSFNFDAAYSQRDLYDWVCAELVLTEGLATQRSTHQILLYLRAKVMRDRMRDGDPPFDLIPLTQEFMELVRWRMWRQARATAELFQPASPPSPDDQSSSIPACPSSSSPGSRSLPIPVSSDESSDDGSDAPAPSTDAAGGQ
jgi:hypothetical protein